ncbi:MAG: translation elongation factor Ts [Spirochaetaceae bacterium]|nr:translation elongation factor Ts [Spirochaetaceae bacterium]
MAISAADVKALREQTGAGMMDCKKALVDTNGDFDAAAKLLKEKGLAAVEKRAERATKEGRLFIRQTGNKIAVAELVCETDFVAKNEEFITCGEKILDEVFAKGYTEPNKELNDVLLDFATRTRENMSLNKIKIFNVPDNSAVGQYIHSDKKSGAIVIITGSTDDAVKEFARDCCMHLVAFTPAYNTQKDVPEAYIKEQTEIFKSQMDQDSKMAGKPQNVKDGILQGKIKKHLAEICFTDQMFVKDDKKTVKAKLDEVAKAVNAKLDFNTIELFLLGK